MHIIHTLDNSIPTATIISLAMKKTRYTYTYPHSRRMRYHDYILMTVVTVPILYGIASMYFLSALSQHENDSLLFSPATLRSRSSEISKFLPTAKPRVFGYYFSSVSSSSLAPRPPSVLPVHWETALYELYPSKRMVLWEKRDKERQEALMDSKPYDQLDHNPLKPYENHKECVPMHDWQTQAFPTCNSVHETDLRNVFHKRNRKYHELVRILAHGYFRDVYMTKDVDAVTNIALKTNRFERRFDQWTMDRHRMDALVMDRMTSSSNIMDIYGYCGVGSLVEYADGGDLMTLINEESSASADEKSESIYFRRLQYALEVANALADLHTIDSKDGKYSSIVHGKNNISMLLPPNHIFLV